jgi:SAM-dependent methyltransferase
MNEPLERSAPLARAIAAETCRGCAWYHGLWQYLRLLGAIEPMARHAAFFEDALARLAGAPRILVCGAADYWMLARVRAAFRGRTSRPLVTVSDLCETPLELNRWYARHAGVRVRTRRCDVFDFHAPGRFDAICTHALFGRFPPERRPALVARWRSLLRPGGVVVTVTPVRPGDTRVPVAFEAERADAFAAAVRAAAEKRAVDAPALAEAARAYAGRMKVHRVRSDGELRALFGGGGFRIEELSRAPAGGLRTAAGPTAAGAAYARIVARRP